MSDSEPESEYIFYYYNPSLAAAVIFIVLFVVSTGGHIFQLTRKRTWSFIPFVIGGLFEVVGYIGRVVSSTETPDWSTMPYVIQSILLLLAPALFAASIYMVLGRIIRLTDGEAHSIIKPKWITKLFVAGDVLSFLAQSAGGSMLASAKTAAESDRGDYVIIVGLGIQVLFFGFFIVVAGLFHYRINAFPSARSQTLEVPWQRFLLVLYSASTFIMIRSIFRMAEYILGHDGVLAQSEIYLYVFDATLMFLAMLLFNIWHPSRIITNEKRAGEKRLPILSINNWDPRRIFANKKSAGGKRPIQSQDSSHAMTDKSRGGSTEA